MTTKISGSMEDVLKDVASGSGSNDPSVHGPLVVAARVSTCNALVKRGLMFQTLFGEYLLTEAGEALANTLNGVRTDQQSV